MTTIPQVSQAMQTVLTTTVEAADAQLHYTKRPDQAKFSASTLVQTLVFGFLAHPDASLEQLAQTAVHLDVEVSTQAIDQRFTSATATLLQQVLIASLHHTIAAAPVAIPLLQRFTGVYVHDSTTIVLPDSLAEEWAGCGGSTTEHTAAALKCGVQFELLSGAIHGLDLADGRAADRRLPVQHAALPKRSLRLADLGFYDLAVLNRLNAEGVYWLSKLPATAVITAEQSAPQGLLQFVEALGALAQWEGQVWVGKGRRVQARLLLQRVPQEVADQRRRRIREEARRKGRTPSAVTLALAAWTLVITNVPETLLTLAEALILLKVRWQIELLFKLWKSHGQLDQWRSDKPMRILCEVYAKLLGMVVQQWVLIVSCWGYAERSLVKAAQVVRDHAIELASARAESERLSEVLTVIQRVLKRTARMTTRSKHPNTYQLLLALTTTDEQA